VTYGVVKIINPEPNQEITEIRIGCDSDGYPDSLGNDLVWALNEINSDQSFDWFFDFFASRLYLKLVEKRSNESVWLDGGLFIGNASYVYLVESKDGYSDWRVTALVSPGDERAYGEDDPDHGDWVKANVSN
jgi:hypothetical protein